jgi:hypothetical protein
MRTAMRRVFANPSVTPLLIFSLVVTGLFLWHHLGREAWQDWRQDRAIARAAHWSPEPWGLTADEFPGLDAAELPVDISRMTTVRQPGWSVSAVTYGALGPLFAGTTGADEFGFASDGTDGVVEAYPTDATSGVDVDGVQVVTFVTVSPFGPYASEGRASPVTQLRYEASVVSDATFRRHSPVWNPAGTVLSAEFVGRELTEREYFELTKHDLGAVGPFGITTHQRGADGREFRTTSLATVAEGALVSVGVLVPDGEELPADLEPAVLLERLADEVRADPPTHGTTG